MESWKKRIDLVTHLLCNHLRSVLKSMQQINSHFPNKQHTVKSSFKIDKNVYLKSSLALFLIASVSNVTHNIFYWQSSNESLYQEFNIDHLQQQQQQQQQQPEPVKCRLYLTTTALTTKKTLKCKRRKVLNRYL